MTRPIRNGEMAEAMMQRREFLAAGGPITTMALSRAALSQTGFVGDQAEGSRPASGPLRVHPKNPRYFADAAGRALLLTGSHMWNNLVDMGPNDPPKPLDFEAYLDFLQRYGHNFIRLWTWDSVTWDTRANRGLGRNVVHRVAPHPWRRVGPGKALDGKPKFDLKQFDPAYFRRLRSRVDAARRRGIYVSVMLFEGWALRHGNLRRGVPAGWAWRGHPFHPANNINGIDAGVKGDANIGRPHSLGNREVNAVQTAYIRKVVDTINDLDNVLYEVINEGGEQQWDWWVVETVREYERGKPKQHPVGITGHGAERLKSMLASPADWISPGSQDGYGDDPPAWEGRKVSLLDTDHVWGIGGNGPWVWKAFLRGHNPLFMDPYDGSVLGKPFDPQWEPVRLSLGFARRLADGVDLAAMTPHDKLASTAYCLADPGSTYLVYVPSGKRATVALTAAEGRFIADWLNCHTGRSEPGGSVAGGANRVFDAPFAAEAVLRLEKAR